ncbi:hypothetical protein RGU70_15270 [Herbaspirillum sp. RTI4]|nr:hypothetical protein [Herbaspirillum sp. RTI4]MDY7579675.1 hypothetical protein [Herbaspirillum sp. RTI4]MEA9981890.1 hypothetical protein [Herbaspirillum sp. RTI4]
MKKLIKLLLLAVVACSMLSACIIVPGEYSHHRRGSGGYDYYGR